MLLALNYPRKKNHSFFRQNYMYLTSKCNAAESLGFRLSSEFRAVGKSKNPGAGRGANGNVVGIICPNPLIGMGLTYSNHFCIAHKIHFSLVVWLSGFFVLKGTHLDYHLKNSFGFVENRSFILNVKKVVWL